MSKLTYCSYLTNIVFFAFLSYFLYSNHLSLYSKLPTSIFKIVFTGTGSMKDLCKLPGKSLCLPEISLYLVTKALYSFLLMKVFLFYISLQFKQYQCSTFELTIFCSLRKISQNVTLKGKYL